MNNLKPLIRLAIPLVLTGIMQSSVFFFQTLFLARLGQESLAAGALVIWVFCTVYVILFGILSSINVLVAHKHGANDKIGISRVVRDGVWLAILLAFPTFLLFWNWISPLLAFAGQSPAIISLTSTYLHAMAWGILPNFIVLAVLEVMIGLGRGRHILIFNLISVALNIVFNFAFIFGRFGFSALGIAGAGWGMTVSNSITAILIITTVLLNKEYRAYFNLTFTFTKPSYLLELLKIGIPMGAMYCVEVGFFLTLTLLMGAFGSQFLAANQITMQYVGLFITVVFSTAQAITVRMGHLLGAGDVVNAARASTIGIALSTGFMMIVGLAFCVYPELLLSIDINVADPTNANLIYHAKQFLMIAAFVNIFEAMRISLFGALRALKDTHFTLLISIVCFWGIALPLGYLLATPMHIGATGLWWGMVFGAAIGVILLYYRFKSKLKNYQLKFLNESRYRQESVIRNSFMIRRAEDRDITHMVALSEKKRIEYEKVFLQFWKRAENSDELQFQWFETLLNKPNYFIYVADDDKIIGFIIGQNINAPDVYNPGGFTLMIDDFCVESPDLWETVGKKLLADVAEVGKENGAVQILVVSGHHDKNKKVFLQSQGLRIASEWYLKSL